MLITRSTSPLADQVDDVRRALADLVDPASPARPSREIAWAVPAGGDHLEAEVVEAGGELGRRRLVGVGDGDEDRALAAAARRPAAACALPKAVGKSAAMPITSPVLFISGPSTESAPAKRAKGSTASLTLTWLGGSLGQLLVGEPLAQHQPAGDLRQRRPDRLARRRARCARRAGWPRSRRARRRRPPYWMLIRPITPSSSAIRAVVVADLLEHLLAEAHRRDHAGRVAGVDARPPRRAA